MKTAAAVQHYGSKYAVAKRLGIRVQSVQQWGPVVPLLRAVQLAQLEENPLELEPDDYAQPTDLVGQLRKEPGRTRAARDAPGL